MKNLKKIQASSLVETLVATVVIMIVFGIAMMSIGNILENNIQQNTQAIDTELHKLQYQYENGLLEVPDERSFGQWKIKITAIKEANISYVVFKGTHLTSKKVRSTKSVTQ